jgi:hypothetical protein
MHCILDAFEHDIRGDAMKLHLAPSWEKGKASLTWRAATRNRRKLGSG